MHVEETTTFCQAQQKKMILSLHVSVLSSVTLITMTAFVPEDVAIEMNLLL